MVGQRGETPLVSPYGRHRYRMMALTMTQRVLTLDPSSYQRHRLHTQERNWAETNCYVDLWIELLHAWGFEPLAAMPFTLAIAMVHQSVRIEHFTGPDAIKDKRVLAAARKVHHQFDASLDPADMTPGDVTIRTVDGRQFHKRIPYAYGSPQNPLKKGGLEEKFLDCVTHSITPIKRERAESLIEKILNLETVASVEEIIP